MPWNNILLSLLPQRLVVNAMFGDQQCGHTVAIQMKMRA